MRGALLVLILGLLASRATAQDNSVARIDDAGITVLVKAALVANKATKATQITVLTREGVVQLSGFVDSEVTRQAAVSTARNRGGVKDVQDRLLIRGANRGSGPVMEDTVIAAKLKSELAGAAGLIIPNEVVVEVNSGIVALSGFVADFDQKNKAAQIARRISGVMDVKNNISVRTRS